MQKDNREKILFVINPVSGGKEKQDWEGKVPGVHRPAQKAKECQGTRNDNERQSPAHQPPIGISNFDQAD